MTTVRRILLALLGTLALGVAPEPSAVRVWQDVIELPTYTEGAPNPNPPFDLFTFGRFNYPYPIRDALTNTREAVRWRALHLENEYLRLTVLPDLGGHIYSCLDKRNGREMFYANASIKKALIGYRGAWAAFGVEFNFPVSHNWMSMSPVDFATTQDADGSGSISVGNTDQVYGSRWRVELRLYPGRSVLEERVDLYNQSDVRHRYYWWTNAGVQAWEDSHLVYPTQVMATHGFTAVEPWPVDRKGRDLSVIRNQTDGPVSLFTYKTREGFVGVYHPHTQSGTVTVTSPAQLPVHKVWSWGWDRDAAGWRTALSDDDSAYVELQSGLFRNQETYAFLDPQETVHFSESWLPVRDLGGITRATQDAIVNIERPSPETVRIALDVTRDLPGAHVNVHQADVNVLERGVSLSPRDVWRADVTVSSTPVTFDLTDSAGRLILRHTEHSFDLTPASSVRLGPTNDVTPRASEATIELGTTDELEGRRLAAMARYEAALAREPRSTALLQSGGRLAVALGWADAGGDSAQRAIDWLNAAYARNTTDFETRYYLGLALAAAGHSDEARPHLEAAARFRSTRTSASLALARLDAATDPERALQEAATATRCEGCSIAGAVESALLRRLHRAAEARDAATRWHRVDPTSSLLRYELVRSGEQDARLWEHLGADANRVLDLVDQYLALGSYDDALALLDRDYPAVDPPQREPGAVAPNKSPLVVYYRGFVRERLRQSGARDYETASRLSTTYVFPHRRSAYAVLNAALKANPADATARFLLGSNYLASGLVDPAIDMWQAVRSSHPPLPTLHRNLALALLFGRHDFTRARTVLEEGIAADSNNQDIYLTLDGVLSAAHAPAEQRVAALERFPALDRMPAALVYKLALARAEAGDAAGAEALFHDRFFPSEEGGNSARAVYLQARVTSAAWASTHGKCRDALDIVSSLGRERPGLPFTAGGYTEMLQSPANARQIAQIDAACGRQEDAKEIRQRLTQALSRDSGNPLVLAIADEARRQLGRERTAAERQRLENALDSATKTMNTGGTSNPSVLELGRALLLEALGRTAESRQALQQVFVYPDRNLSHALARQLLVTQ
jgi:tetratricopeptide (TPR) repeat protein